jgi:hypothetical protein
LLRPTDKARAELIWHREQVREIAKIRRAALAGVGEGPSPGADLKRVLQGLAQLD